MSYVYWLHLESHSDITSEGYIGITSKQPTTRFSEHKSASKTCDSIIHRAMRKYGADIKLTVLLEADLDYCKYIEFTLRASERIGWNMAIGGLSGTPHSEETLLKMSASQLKCWEDPDRRAKFSEMKKKIPVSEATRAAQKEARKLVPSWKEVRANPSFWQQAGIFYDFYKANPEKGHRTYSKTFGIPSGNFLVILKKFKKHNWIPHEDANWLQWYAEQNKNKGN